MGRPALRLGDIGSGHDCHFPPSVAIEGSSNIFINDRPAVRKGDAYEPHGCEGCLKPPHPRRLAKGAPSVRFNDRPAGRLNEPIDCGGEAIEGSPNVFIGEPCPPKTRKPFRDKCECDPPSDDNSNASE